MLTSRHSCRDGATCSRRLLNRNTRGFRAHRRSHPRPRPRQPVAGASIQLYAAGTTGYGIGATALLSTPATTGSDGTFTITGGYTCPSASSHLYIVASGGNPGLAQGTNNTRIVLIAVLGACALHSGVYTLDPASFIQINEVTTVASVFALTGFMNATTGQIGATSTNATGLANAFLTEQNLVSNSAGLAYTATPAGNGVVPQSSINSLADSIASCVNSNGMDTACSTLFAATTPSGGTTPANTLQVVYNIATHPASQVSTFYNLSTTVAPFQPTLSRAPNDWAIGVVYTDASISNPVALSIDASGNIWIANNGFSVNTSSVTEVSPTGVNRSGVSGYTGGGMSRTDGLWIDVNGNIWVSDSGNNNVVKLSSSGVILSGSSGYTASGMDFLRGLAVDSSGVIWVGNYGGNNPASVFMLSNNGTSSQSFTATHMNSPDAPMVDAGGNIWFANEISDTLTKFSSKGTVLSDSGYSISKPGILRMDATGGVWTMNIFNQNMEHISGTGASLSGVSGYVTCVPQSMGDLSTSCPGFAGARGFGIDGAASLWAPLYYVSSNFITHTNISRYGFAHLDSSGNIFSGATGVGTDYGIAPTSMEVDAAGNLWGVQSTQSKLIQLIGIATPTVTPYSVAAQNNIFAVRP
ncbi:MAG: hypothetical protein ABI147_07410 [Acidobacteriaceae bacterium]